jgi:hypothetical protein
MKEELEAEPSETRSDGIVGRLPGATATGKREEVFCALRIFTTSVVPFFYLLSGQTMKILAILGVAAFAIACDSPTSPTTTASIARATGTANAVVDNERTEAITVAPDNCNGDAILVDVVFHDTFRLTFDNGGGIHIGIHENVAGKSIFSASGIDYVVNQTINESINAKYGEEETITEHYNLIAKGSAPNARLLADFHITITPNGDVTSFHDNFRIECQGA